MTLIRVVSRLAGKIDTPELAFTLFQHTGQVVVIKHSGWRLIC